MSELDLTNLKYVGYDVVDDLILENQKKYAKNKIKFEVKILIHDRLPKSDLIIIHTEWNEFKLIDLKKIVKKRNFIVYDMRNIYSPEKMRKQNIKYFGVGR